MSLTKFLPKRPFSSILPQLLQWNYSLLGLLLLVVFVSWDSFSPEWVPTHDSFQVFQGFHYFYSHFYFTGELPRWSMYATYGTPVGLWQLLLISPANYFAIFAGWVLGVEDVLFLFKFSLFLEKIILLIGTYLLSSFLYRKQITVFFVCFGVIGCTLWYAQLWWNFRIYYFLPLILYYLFLFLAQKKPHYFWLAGIFSVVSLFGNLTYFGIPWAYLFIIILLVLSIRQWKSWKCLLHFSSQSGVYILIFLGLCFLYFQLLFYSTQTMVMGLGGRDSSSFKTSLDIFLSWGGLVDLQQLARMTLYGWPVHSDWSHAPDNSFYIGLLPIPLILYALGKIRSLNFYALLGGVVFLVWFAGASGLASTLYFIPGFSLFRHLGLLFGLIKILLFFCAGFGLEKLLLEQKKRVVLAFYILILFLVDFFTNENGAPVDPWWQMKEEWSNAVVLRLSFYFVPVLFVFLFAFLEKIEWSSWWQEKIPRVKHLSKISRFYFSFIIVLLVMAYVLDITLFSSVVNKAKPIVHCKNDCLASTFLSRPEFYNKRESAPKTEKEKKSIELVSSMTIFFSINVMMFHFAQHDPWWATYNWVLHPPGVKKLEEIKNGINGSIHDFPEFDRSFQNLLGWHHSKFRLLSHPFFAESSEEATSLIKKTEEIDRILVLEDVPKAQQTSLSSLHAGEEDGRITVKKGHANLVEIEAEVTSGKPTWLVYSDSFHSGWRATVNGKDVSIAKAYLAFKAIPLEKGINKIRFTFDQEWQTYLPGILGWVGLFSFLWLSGIFFSLLRRHPDYFKSESE